MTERAISTYTFDNADELAEALELALEDSHVNRSTVYVRGDFYQSGKATLMEETLTDGSKVYNVALSSRR